MILKCVSRNSFSSNPAFTVKKEGGKFHFSWSHATLNSNYDYIIYMSRGQSSFFYRNSFSLPSAPENFFVFMGKGKIYTSTVYLTQITENGLFINDAKLSKDGEKIRLDLPHPNYYFILEGKNLASCYSSDEKELPLKSSLTKLHILHCLPQPVTEDGVLKNDGSDATSSKEYFENYPLAQKSNDKSSSKHYFDQSSSKYSQDPPIEYEYSNKEKLAEVNEIEPTQVEFPLESSESILPEEEVPEKEEVPENGEIDEGLGENLKNFLEDSEKPKIEEFLETTEPSANQGE